MPKPRLELDLKEIVRLHEGENLSFRVIAKRLGCGKTAVNNAYRWAKESEAVREGRDAHTEETRAKVRDAHADAVRENALVAHTQEQSAAHARAPEVRDEEEFARALRAFRALPEWKEIEAVLEWWRKRSMRERAHRAPGRMVSRGVRIREELFEGIQEFAEEEGVSANEAINRIVEAGLKALS